MKFVVNQVAYKELTESPTGMTGMWLRRRALRLQMLAQIQVGKKTGKLKNDIKYKVVRDSRGLIATVGANNKIALMHHNGTRPHIILPKRAQTLRFFSRGRIVYAKVVHHPGTKPNKYLTDNLSRVIRMQ